MKLEKIYVLELLQELDGPECTSSNHLREGNGSDRLEKYKQHAGRERVVRLIEDILADPRVAAKHLRRLQQACVQFKRSVLSEEGALNLESPQ